MGITKRLFDKSMLKKTSVAFEDYNSDDYKTYRIEKFWDIFCDHVLICGEIEKLKYSNHEAETSKGKAESQITTEMKDALRRFDRRQAIILVLGTDKIKPLGDRHDQKYYCGIVRDILDNQVRRLLP